MRIRKLQNNYKQFVKHSNRFETFQIFKYQPYVCARFVTEDLLVNVGKISVVENPQTHTRIYNIKILENVIKIVV